MNIGSILPVGTIIHSMLSTTQFASEYGDKWVLADGRSAAGTLYGSVTGFSVIPDLRGAFLRAKGATWNPDGDLAIGTYTADKIGSHLHPIAAGNVGGSSPGGSGTAAGAGNSSVNTDTNTSAGNETSPRSVTVNVFIRIN